MEVFIKNMVCDRCRMMVKSGPETLGLHQEIVELEVMKLQEAMLTDVQLAAMDKQLSAIGFVLLDNPERKMVEKIKTAVIALIHYENNDNYVKHSEYLVQQVGKDYPYLSKTFSEEEGLTIEQYIIQQKIEKIKELLTYGELTLSEIAWQMGYSSVAAISAQFKKVTGLTPSEYKATEDKKRKTLDTVRK